MDVQTFFQQYGLWVGLMGVFIALSIVSAVVRTKQNKKLGQTYRSQHPDAARVYLTNKALITSEAVTVYSVDGAAPAYFNEGGKTGFFLKPGDSSVNMSYSYTRPGVMYKSVTKTTGAVTRVLAAEAAKSYVLGFDRDKEEFTFELAD